MTERTERGASSGSAPSAAPAGPPQAQTYPPVDIEKIADKVYQMMLRDLALARERGMDKR